MSVSARVHETLSDRPRLLVVVTRIDVGGVPEHIMILLDHLASRYETTVACREVIPEHAERLARAGVKVHLIDLARVLSPWRDARALLHLAGFIRKGQVDIVHTHMSKGALIGGIAGRLGNARVVINTAHNFGWLALTNPILRRIFWLYDKLLFAMTLDRLVTISRLQEDQIVDAGLISRERVKSVLNGIDADKLRCSAASGVTRADLGVEPQDLLVICAARLVWFKAVDRLIEAVALLGDRAARVKVLILGDGDQRPALERLVIERGLQERVRLLGARHDVPRLLGLADIFALSSVSEGMPIALMEAMAMGLPVVTTAVDGTPELVLDGETGLLVPPRDTPAFAAALGRLLADAELRQRLGAAGRARVEAHFTDRAMATGMDALYRDLLGRSAGKPSIAKS